MPKDTARTVILAVDDEPANNELVVRTLRNLPDCTVITACSGAEALERTRHERVDVMIVDQSMPGMSGLEMVRRAQVLAPNAATVLMTAFPELAEVVQAKRDGLVRHVIAKPWQATALVDAVRQVVALLNMRGAVAALGSSRNDE